LLLGHYNKRPKSEIPASSPLHPFFLTGLGLKLRAHPLAIAMADEQLDHLDEWLALKNARAAAFSEMLSALPAIILPNTANRVPAWYAYVFQVDEAKSGGVTARQVHAALQAEGLREADMPGSTGPIHKLPLFTRTPEVMGRLYREPCIAMDASFPGAERFARQAIKYPVWAMEEDAATVDLYRDKTYAVLKSLLRRG
ncbi:MAG: DegT/DnrJ/EryC1/StrS family aminotransferase, partial [Rhodomicrobium sp.]